MSYFPTYHDFKPNQPNNTWVALLIIILFSILFYLSSCSWQFIPRDEVKHTFEIEKASNMFRVYVDGNREKFCIFGWFRENSCTFDKVKVYNKITDDKMEFWARNENRIIWHKSISK